MDGQGEVFLLNHKLDHKSGILKWSHRFPLHLFPAYSVSNVDSCIHLEQPRH